MVFRNTGAVGALLDEYEKAINELKFVIDPISENGLLTIVDQNTKDDACRSIQTVLTHVVKAGYTYANLTREYLGDPILHTEQQYFDTIADYQKALDKMFDFNVKLFSDHPNLPLNESIESKKVLSSWGQYYSIEQLYEHAIVHILRHRRQIQRFLIELRN